MVDLFFMKTFMSVADTGSFRTAADRNFITQPAVTQHIQILERKLGAKLIERQGKTNSLTPAGKIFYEHAEKILRQYEEAQMQIGEIDKKYCGSIRISTIYSIGLYSLQPIVKKFLKKYPKVDIHLEYNKSNTIYEKVLNRSIDFGLVAFPHNSAGIISNTFSEEKLILIQSKDKPIFNKKSISLIEIHQTKFISFSSKTPTGKVIEQFLKKHNITPKIVHEYDNIETLKSAVQLGMGCAIVPKNSITSEIKEKSLTTVAIPELKLKRPLSILYPHGKTFTQSMKTFHNLMIKKKP